MDSPDVTIIVATQGKRPSLREALVSALAQEEVRFEIVVVDDAPANEPDWTGHEKCKPLLTDPRVRVVTSRQAKGCAAAKNVGLDAACGDWVCYLDDDNVMRSNRLVRQLELARAGESPVVLCGMEIQVATRRRIRQVNTTNFTGNAQLMEVLPDTNVLFHRRDCGVRWDEDLRTTDDACFFQRILIAHHVSEVPNVPDPLVIYRTHGSVRANSDWLSLYRGQRRLLMIVRDHYPREVRRRALLRALVANEKLRVGRWGRFVVLSISLMRHGGWRELRPLLNAVGVKCPLTRRWMVR